MPREWHIQLAATSTLEFLKVSQILRSQNQITCKITDVIHVSWQIIIFKVMERSCHKHRCLYHLVALHVYYIYKSKLRSRTLSTVYFCLLNKNKLIFKNISLLYSFVYNCFTFLPNFILKFGLLWIELEKSAR
jgi:hypothetical protein